MSSSNRLREKSCTPDTCMRLQLIGGSQQAVCGDCVRYAWCKWFLRRDNKETTCDWFPRRFRMVDMELLP